MTEPTLLYCSKTTWIIEIENGFGWYKGLVGKEINVYEAAIYNYRSGEKIPVWLLTQDREKGVKRFIRKIDSMIVGMIDNN